MIIDNRNKTRRHVHRGGRYHGLVLAMVMVCSIFFDSVYSGASASGKNDSTSGLEPAFPLPAHLDQRQLPGIAAGRIIEWGGKLFRTEYNQLDGAGSNLSGDPAGTIRFTRIPRMDLPGFAANPTRTSGPNSQSCVACHGLPFVGGAGSLHDMEIRDSQRSGDPGKYIQRNPLHLFGSGALQLLAEQVSQELRSLREGALAKATKTGQPVTISLVTSNGINYGKLTALPSGQVDPSGVVGMHADLLLRPYTWKGSFLTFLRPLVSLGADTQMGMPTVEFFGENTDFDGDGVINEMTVGDITAMTLYIATLPTPVTELALSRNLGGKYQLSQAEEVTIKHGEAVFGGIGCAECHRPAMKLKSGVFREPSRLPEYRFPLFPSGQDPVGMGLDPNNPVVVDLSMNPQIGDVRNDGACRASRHTFFRDDHSNSNCFLQYEVDEDNNMIVRLYGDLKQHDMGPGLMEKIDEAGTGPSVWKTRELWGVGNTGPWLHDGRATTLEDAILWHGGEAQDSRNQYASLPERDKKAVTRFLRNLVLYRAPAEKYGKANY